MNINHKFFRMISIFFCTVAFALSPACAGSVFNENLTAEDVKNLENGETVIKNLSSIKKLCAEGGNPVLDSVLETARDLKPAYIAEIIKFYPVEGNEDFPQQLESLLVDVPSYAGIPYYSERAEKWYDLYSEAKILSAQKIEGGQKIRADLVMEPFDLIETEIILKNNPESLYYESTNLSKLRYYDKFDCVSPRKMKSLICVFKDGDRWVLYGIGAVKAPSIFFLRERIEVSFMNRIKTFCLYFFDKIQTE